MADAVAILTWDDPDGTGARRPSIDDVGGATLIDDDTNAPDKASMLYADACNQWQKQIVALGRTAKAARILVTFTGGTPAVTAATGPGSAVVPSLFTVTDNGVGDTTISWPALSLPPGLGIGQMVTCHGTLPPCYTAVGGTNSVRVRTWDMTTGSPVAADIDFTLETG